MSSDTISQFYPISRQSSSESSNDNADHGQFSSDDHSQHSTTPSDIASSLQSPSSFSPSLEDVTSRQPYATLNECCQKGALRDLEYTDKGSDSTRWRAEVSVRHEDLGIVTREGLGGSKQVAKRQAASSALGSLLSALPWPSLSAHRPQAPTHSLPSPTPHSTLTVKQTRMLVEAEGHLELLRQIALDRGRNPHVLLSVDVEKDPGSSEIWEVGLASAISSDSWMIPDIRAEHLVVEEFANAPNPLKGYGMCHRFNFGRSKLVAKGSLAAVVSRSIARLTDGAERVVFVGHSIHNDIGWLKAADVRLEMPVCDVAKAYQAQCGALQLISLQHMMDRMCIDCSSLHNGGNDAFHTAELCLKMVDLLDQRPQ